MAAGYCSLLAPAYCAWPNSLWALLVNCTSPVLDWDLIRQRRPDRTCGFWANCEQL